MLHARRLAAALAVSFLVFSAVGCADDVSQSNNGTNNNDRITNPGDAPDNGELRHVDPCPAQQVDCVVELTTNTERELSVKLVDGDDAPVKDVLVDFETTFPDIEAAVSSRSAYTNEQGIAVVNLTAGAVPGSGQVVASTNSEGIEPIKWIVDVTTKTEASYRVSFDHVGSAEIKPLTVRLFDDSTLCEDLDVTPMPGAQIERSDQVDAANNFPTVVFPDIANGTAYTVAAWGYSLDNDEVELAYGCKDGNPAINGGRSVDVTVPLIDHIPNLVGEYQVTHEFDLTNALPENVRTVVDLIGRLANDPGSFVVGCPANSSDPDCPSGSEGIVQLLVDFLPDGSFANAVEGFLSSDVGNSIARDAINSVAQGWLDNNAPDWVGNTVNVTSDILYTLRHFRVEGIMRFTDAPEIEVDDEGHVVGILPENSGEQSWQDFVFKWSGGCENAPDPAQCAQRSFGANQLDIDTAEGTFDGAVFGSNELQINQHSLSLNYGALVIAMIEKFVLPRIFGNNCGPQGNRACDSLEATLRSMIDCDSVADIAGDDGAVHDVAETACTTLLNQVGSKIREYASEQLVADGSDRFLIGTPDGQNCTIAQPDPYQSDWENKPLPYIQYLGKEEPADMQCKWDVRIRFSDSYTAEVDGNFWGERSSF